MTVGVLTTCHTQHTWDRSICVFLFNRTTLQVFVTYLTGALYVHPLWLYKHQHDNRVRSKLFVACRRWWFQWRLWFVPSVPGYLREHKPDPWRNPIERNHMGLHLENEVAVVKTPTIISNNPVFKWNQHIFSSSQIHGAIMHGHHMKENKRTAVASLMMSTGLQQVSDLN